MLKLNNHGRTAGGIPQMTGSSPNLADYGIMKKDPTVDNRYGTQGEKAIGDAAERSMTGFVGKSKTQRHGHGGAHTGAKKTRKWAAKNKRMQRRVSGRHR